MILLPTIGLSRCAPGMVTAMGVSANLTPGPITKAGTAERKQQRWAPALMTIHKIVAWAITEPWRGGHHGDIRPRDHHRHQGELNRGGKARFACIVSRVTFARLWEVRR